MKKDYPIEVVLSLTTGYLLKEGGFSDMHELAEHVVGHPIWTHEFVDRALWTRMQELVFSQHPQLRDVESFDREAAKEDIGAYLGGYVARAVAKYGATLSIDGGSDERTESPLASAQRVFGDKPIIAVVK